ncbi:MAG: PDZ domain-containing protein, partial [Verrucomicrobiota bacterium]
VIEDQFGKTPAIREIGFIVDNIYSIDEDKRNIAKRNHQINERLQVIKVMKDSIAHEAGLQPGDKLLQINDVYIPKTADAIDFIALKIVPHLDPKENISFLIIRGRHAIQLETKEG